MKIFPVLAFLTIANTAAAQEALSAEEFDTLSLGTTLYFSQDGRFYGAEQFLENRRSVWRAEDGSCINGQWEEFEGGICFLYDGDDQPHCWSVARDNGKIIITNMFPRDEQPATVLEMTNQDTVPIICTGPSVGV